MRIRFSHRVFLSPPQLADGRTDYLVVAWGIVFIANRVSRPDLKARRFRQSAKEVFRRRSSTTRQGSDENEDGRSRGNNMAGESGVDPARRSFMVRKASPVDSSAGFVNK